MPHLSGSPRIASSLAAQPTSASLVQEMPRQAGAAWNPLSRWPDWSRQALAITVAVVLAGIAGQALSQPRWYWAATSAFVTVSSAVTTSEFTLRGYRRIAGTLTGLLAGTAIALVSGTSGPLVVSIVAVFYFGTIYLQPYTYIGSVLCLTVILAELFKEQGKLTLALTGLRLAETALGCAIGVLTGLVAASQSSRRAVRFASQQHLSAVAELLSAAADGLSCRNAGADDQALITNLDVRLAELIAVVKPLTHPLIIAAESNEIEHRLAIHQALTWQTTALAENAQRSPGEDDPSAARAGHLLASVARSLADGEPASKGVSRADGDLFAVLPSGWAAPGSSRAWPQLVAIGALLDRLADLTSTAGARRWPHRGLRTPRHRPGCARRSCSRRSAGSG